MPKQKTIYLDYASTTPTCAPTLQAMNEYYKKYRANVHRGIYDISEKATTVYETSRDSVAKFINAERKEIIFTSGATAGLNQLAYSLTPKLSHRDNIVLTRFEHHANIVPWQEMAKHYGFEIRFADLDENFQFLISNFQKCIDSNTKIVSFALVSNVLGTIAPAETIIKIAKKISPRVITIVDAAQAMAHLPIDIRDLDCDFLVFSAHKMYGPTGTGVLYGKKIMLEEHLEPFFFGGEMVQAVSYDQATWADIPHRFEAGTPNIAGVIGLGAAVEFIKKLGWKKIQSHEQNILKYAVEKLAPLVNIVGTKNYRKRVGLVSFTVAGVHAHDVAQILNQENICVRAGYHCAEPLHRHLGLTATVRGSFGIHTTKKDIDRLTKGIEKVKKMFK